MKKSSPVRTRFAPSPTGYLHIGSLRTALYAYALAKHNKGDFILRIEDTDKKREVKGATQALQKTLSKFGLEWDEFYVQSERLDLYKKAAEKLVEEGHAFYCQCKSKNAKDEGFSTQLRDPCRDKGLTSGAIKLKVPQNQTVSYYDFVHKKEIAWNTDEVYDATLLKSDGYPTYHLGVVVDDSDMKISHIIRGHDWLPSTPIHLLVFDYLVGHRPEIGHLSDILSSTTGKKLSKRRDSVYVEQFLDEGYLPEALLNFIMLLGWAPKDNRELYSLEDFVNNFDINGFQQANPKFFIDKLDWYNGHYIRQKSDKQLSDLMQKFLPDASIEMLTRIASLIKERIKKISEVKSYAGFFFEAPKVDMSLLGKNYKNHIQKAIETIEIIEAWDLEHLNEQLMATVKKNDFKTRDFFMDLRIAITGAKYTPPINESMILLGKEQTLKRLKEI
jgi:nondiscriminating glutamyl-tRNA synthetase